MKSLTIFACLFTGLSLVAADLGPCDGNKALGDECDVDSDCSGFGVICNRGTCKCHEYYKQLEDSNGRKSCQKIPDQIDARCTDVCRPPLLCYQGACKCIRSTVRNGKCVAAAKLGDPCTKHSDCSIPFSACTNSQCSCIVGTSPNNGACTAAQRCPDGASAKGNCFRYIMERSDVIENFGNSGGKADNCPDKHFCVTADNSNSGFCCPQSCPFGDASDSRYSCAPNATRTQKCPDQTHFCHYSSGSSFSIAECCRRPCKEPTPLYINGDCYPRSSWGEACRVSEQCDGGITMECKEQKCQCKGNFKPVSDSTTGTSSPPPTCVPECGSFGILNDMVCLTRKGLGDQCLISQQCPDSSICFRGACACGCGYTKAGGKCQKESATQAPGVTTQPGGTTKADLLGLFKGFLGGFGGNLGGLGGIGG